MPSYSVRALIAVCMAPILSPFFKSRPDSSARLSACSLERISFWLLICAACSARESFCIWICFFCSLICMTMAVLTTPNARHTAAPAAVKPRVFFNFCSRWRCFKSSKPTPSMGAIRRNFSVFITFRTSLLFLPRTSAASGSISSFTVSVLPSG